MSTFLVSSTDPLMLLISSQYVNYGMGDEKARDVFAGNYERLSALKAKYDPKNVFNKWVNIIPAKA